LGGKWVVPCEGSEMRENKKEGKPKKRLVSEERGKAFINQKKRSLRTKSSRKLKKGQRLKNAKAKITRGGERIYILEGGNEPQEEVGELKKSTLPISVLWEKSLGRQPNKQQVEGPGGIRINRKGYHLFSKSYHATGEGNLRKGRKGRGGGRFEERRPGP